MKHRSNSYSAKGTSSNMNQSKNTPDRLLRYESIREKITTEQRIGSAELSYFTRNQTNLFGNNTETLTGKMFGLTGTNKESIIPTDVQVEE